MLSFNPSSTSRQPRPLPELKSKGKKLLLVCDSAERLSALRAALSAGELEVTSAASLDELRRACLGCHQLAVIDVAPGRVVEVLKTLRASEDQAALPVLVEATRLAAATWLAGVFSRYRAMPCSDREMVTLARRLLAFTNTERQAKRLL
jgi:DNA-binding NtrC family response regulator